MSFNENIFMMIGTGIAICGVGLYLWDTRAKDAATNAYNSYKNNYQQPVSGGSTRRKNVSKKKTRRR